MRIQYYVDDGYVGKGMLNFEIDDSEIHDCEDMSEVMDMISDMTEEDYQQRVSWFFANRDKIMAEAQEIFDKKENDD